MILAVTAGIIIIGLLMVWFRDKQTTIKRFQSLISVLHVSKNAIAKEYVELLEKYVRVQHGYDQGVLEGKRQAYVNVRAFLADNIEKAEVRERAFLVTWLHPRLAELGKAENEIVQKMKQDAPDPEHAALVDGASKIDPPATTEEPK